MAEAGALTACRRLVQQPTTQERAQKHQENWPTTEKHNHKGWEAHMSIVTDGHKRKLFNDCEAPVTQLLRIRNELAHTVGYPIAH
jgi:hypothetical protein